MNKVKEELKEKIFGDMPLTNQGFDRHLFATAFTPNGIVTFIDALYAGYKTVYASNGGPSTGKTDIMDFISKAALKRGLNVEIFHDSLIPERIEHLLIPDLSTEINNRTFEGIRIYTDNYLNTNILAKNKDEITANKENFYHLINKGLSIIASAKILHDEMEKSYIPSMDFSKVTKVRENIIKRIEWYEQEYLNGK